MASSRLWVGYLPFATENKLLNVQTRTIYLGHTITLLYTCCLWLCGGGGVVEDIVVERE